MDGLNHRDSAVSTYSACGSPEWLVASVGKGFARAYVAVGDARACDEWYARAIDLALDSVPRSRP